jgi:hypothetical protein
MIIMLQRGSAQEGISSSALGDTKKETRSLARRVAQPWTTLTRTSSPRTSQNLSFFLTVKPNWQKKNQKTPTMEDILPKILALGIAENRANEIVKKGLLHIAHSPFPSPLVSLKAFPEKLYQPLLEVAAEAGVVNCDKKLVGAISMASFVLLSFSLCCLLSLGWAAPDAVHELPKGCVQGQP